MKLNFWQILGVVLLVLGGAGLIYEKYLTGPAPAPATSQPATQPLTPPVSATPLSAT